MLGKVNNELGQLLSKGGRQRLSCNRQVINDPEHILQASCLSIELPLRISLAGNLDAIRLVLSGCFRVDQSSALRRTKYRYFLEHSASIQVAIDQVPDVRGIFVLVHRRRLVKEEH